MRVGDLFQMMQMSIKDVVINYQQLSKSMKSFGTTLDQSLQHNSQLIQLPPQNRTLSLPPQKVADLKSAQSYAAVLQQSVVTQDKPLVKEIVTSSDSQMLANTVSTIQVSKVVSLLKILQELLLQDSSNTSAYISWIKELIKRHLGVLVSNPQNKEIVLRLRRWIQKRVAQRERLTSLLNRLPSKGGEQKTRTFKPKFMYYQEEQKQQEDNEILLGEQSYLGQEMDYELQQ